VEDMQVYSTIRTHFSAYFTKAQLCYTHSLQRTLDDIYM